MSSNGKNFRTRAEINAQAEVEQSMTLEQARWLFNDASGRLLLNDKDQEAWFDKRRAIGRLNREDITEDTLT